MRLMASRLIVTAISFATSFGFWQSCLADDNDSLLIKANHIFAIDGMNGEAGEILVVDGKISYVGESAGADSGMKTIEVDSIMPGIVNAFSQAGVAGGDAEVSREVTPEFDTLKAIDFDDRSFSEAIDEGVTTVQILPGTDSVFAGLSCIVKTAGDQERILNKSGSLVLAISSDPTSGNRSRSRPDSIYVRQPTNRMGVVWIVRSTLHRISQGEDITALDSNAETLLTELLKNERNVISVSRTDFDIRSALDLGAELGFAPTIYGGDEVYRIIDEFKERNGKVVFTALTASTSALTGNERTELRWNVPGKLADSEIEFCLAGNNLLDQARFAVRFGLAPEMALSAITLQPAKFLGVADRIGSIQVGKDADLIALSGNPLRPTTAIQWTMVSGKIYDNDKSVQR